MNLYSSDVVLAISLERQRELAPRSAREGRSRRRSILGRSSADH